ncbi:MAG TPA: hypothetical protein VGF99_11855 [Myxococcota bacterium]
MSYAFRSALAAALGLGFVAVVGSACDAALDCNSICTRYAECYDSDYDVEECTDRCIDRSDDSEYRARANECDACINERDCTDTLFQCSGECSEVID